MLRVVEPEWLDHLPSPDPRAVRARRDLRRVNTLMRSATLVAAALVRSCSRPPRSIVEIGAGDGAWMVQLAHALPASWRDLDVVLLDRQDAVTAWALARLAARDWRAEVVAADACAWLAARGDGRSDVVVANLVLHHFELERLAALLPLIAARARVFVACEPRRSQRVLQASRLLGLIGCSAVTRHDASVSVRAGFADRELTALWPGSGAWRLEEGSRAWFSHLFVAASTDGDA